MLRIKFQKDYFKLHRQKTAELLTVREIKIDKNTPQEFMDYDTVMWDGTCYDLKPGVYLQLIFLGDKRIPFCTVRPKFGKFGNKEEYYKNQIGKIFEIEIEEIGNGAK